MTGKVAPASDPHFAFGSAQAANFALAGIPAAARLAPFLQPDAAGPLVVAAPGGWTPSALCREEWAKAVSALGSQPQLVAADGAAGEGVRDGLAELERYHGLGEEGGQGDDRQRLRRLHRAIIKATAKPGDGIVSRHLNRPVSQAISCLVLRLFPATRPLYATVAVAICAMVMVAALVLGGPTGAIVGALLFQAASVLDGVDGEIARASYRTSRSGATLDSVTDGLTNLGFIVGLSVNSYQAGDALAASAGVGGCVALALGLVILGTWAYRRDRRVHFDMLKARFARSEGKLGPALAKIFMRDLFALVFALAVIVGLASWVLWLFAVAASGWLVTVVYAAIRGID